MTPTEALVRSGHKHPEDTLNALADNGFMIVPATDVSSAYRIASEHSDTEDEEAVVCVAPLAEMYRRQTR